jgi:CcmD family protein
MENAVYLFTAFAIVWAVVFGYILYLYIKQRRLWRIVDLLKERNEKGITK